MSAPVPARNRSDRLLDQPRSVDNTVHDLIAISNDLRRHLTEDLRALGYEDLRPAFGPLLSHVWERGLPQTSIAEALGVSVQAASQTVTAAEQAGYVTRMPNPDDGRSKLVTITESGRRLVGHGGEAIGGRSARYAEYVGARRLARLEAALLRLYTGLGAQGQELLFPIESRSAIVASVPLAERATAELRDAVVASRTRAIRAAQTTALVHIAPHGARATDMARAQRVSRQAVSSTMRELEALGYVSRRRDESDGRGVVFTLTARGRGLVEDYVQCVDRLERDYEAILGRTDYVEFAATAYDLRHGIGLERAVAIDRAASGRMLTGSARTDQALADLADQLQRWLGIDDTARLAEELGRRHMDNERARRFRRNP